MESSLRHNIKSDIQNIQRQYIFQKHAIVTLENPHPHNTSTEDIVPRLYENTYENTDFCNIQPIILTLQQTGGNITNF